MLQEGVIGIPPPKSLGLCAGMTNAPYATTTEVYPDSPQADDAQCLTLTLTLTLALTLTRRSSRRCAR